MWCGLCLRRLYLLACRSRRRCWKSLLASPVRGSFAHLAPRRHSLFGSFDENVRAGQANCASSNVTRLPVIDCSPICGVVTEHDGLYESSDGV